SHIPPRCVAAHLVKIDPTRAGPGPPLLSGIPVRLLERFIVFTENAEPLYLFVLTQFRTENRFTLFLELL
ncbi:hypothetical protein, partial [Mesorhizobium sp. M1027]|uniref:hypothetical protein n=1 Tax=Mesorhizobium sp. M1027 TaxID=2957050 RepID=UPI003339066B